jgi:hypothetical protein
MWQNICVCLCIIVKVHAFSPSNYCGSHRVNEECVALGWLEI